MSDDGRGEQIRTADPWPPMPVRYQAAPRPDVYLFNKVREYPSLLSTKTARNIPVTSKPWGCSGPRFSGNQDGAFYTLR
jgi:hypothetical protein